METILYVLTEVYTQSPPSQDTERVHYPKKFPCVPLQPVSPSSPIHLLSP